MKNKYKRRKLILIITISLILVSFTVSFGRYVIVNIHDLYLRTMKFYFQSDKLGATQKVFRIDNWPGLREYPITVELNSRKNYLEKTDYDIQYTVQVTDYSAQYISYSLDKTSGVVDTSDNSDTFNLTITPTGTLPVGALVYIEVEAKATNPYTKTLKGRFEFEVGKEEITFEISDQPGAPYMMVNVTNTISAGTSLITFDFDPSQILLDLTNSNYLHKVSSNTTRISGYDYINKLLFNINSESSTSVRFYKQNVSADYSTITPTINTNLNQYTFGSLITCKGTMN